MDQSVLYKLDIVSFAEKRKMTEARICSLI